MKKQSSILKYAAIIAAVLAILLIVVWNVHRKKVYRDETGRALNSAVITSSELVEFMREAGINADHCVSDEKYVTVTQDWVYGQLSPALNQYLFDNYSRDWKSEENDCDNFALTATTVASSVYHQSKNRMPGTSPAFGMFFYKPLSGGGHAINFAIVDREGKPSLEFYEPQSRLFVSLSRDEIDSCYFWFR